MRTLIIVAFILCSNLLIGQKDWALKVEKNDVKIYVKSVEVSKFKSFKAETIIPLNIQELIAFYKKGENYKNWFDSCIESEIIEQPSANEYFFYTTTEAPWPVSNRDNITKVTFQKMTENKMKINLKDYPNKRPTQEGKIRIPFMEGYWLLESKGENQTKVTLEVLADPGGFLPAWVVNQFITQAPYNTFQNLKNSF